MDKRSVLDLDCTRNAKIQEVTEFNLQAVYDELNRKMFDNELPKIPLKWTRSRKVGGKVEFKIRRNPPEVLRDTVVLKMSSAFKREVENFKLVFIHEMIHVWEIFGSGQSDSDLIWEEKRYKGHGPTFHGKLQELNKKFNINIPLTDETSFEQISDNVKSPEKAVVFFTKNDKPVGMMPFSLKYYEENYNRIHKSLYKLSLRRGDMDGVEVYKSKSRRLLEYKTFRSLGRTITWFTDAGDGIFDEILNDPTTKHVWHGAEDNISEEVGELRYAFMFNYSDGTTKVSIHIPEMYRKNKAGLIDQVEMLLFESSRFGGESDLDSVELIQTDHKNLSRPFTYRNISLTEIPYSEYKTIMTYENTKIIQVF